MRRQDDELRPEMSINGIGLAQTRPPVFLHRRLQVFCCPLRSFKQFADGGAGRILAIRLRLATCFSFSLRLSALAKNRRWRAKVSAWTQPQGTRKVKIGHHRPKL